MNVRQLIADALAKDLLPRLGLKQEYEVVGSAPADEALAGAVRVEVRRAGGFAGLLADALVVVTLPVRLDTDMELLARGAMTGILAQTGPRPAWSVYDFEG